MKKILFFALLATSCLNTINAQVGIGTTNPSSKSILDISSTDKGVLLPRMTTANRIAIAPSAVVDKGLQVFDTDTNSIWFWNGTGWMDTDPNKDDDSLENDPANARVDLETMSDGISARNAGSEFAIKDNGSVGIGTNTPNLAAKLEVFAVNQGVLFPRVALTGSKTWSLDGTATDGMIVYNIATTTGLQALTQGYYYWQIDQWYNFNQSTAVTVNAAATFV